MKKNLILPFISLGFSIFALLFVTFYKHPSFSGTAQQYVTYDQLADNVKILPNPQLTPGSVNPNITQANIDQNICNKNWSTKSIRPPSKYTSVLKEVQLGIASFKNPSTGYENLFASYIPKDISNISQIKTSDYEEDHLISLELGGNPTDPANLWPQSYKTTPNARDKDRVENYLHSQVCAGAITLEIAQREISTNWVVVWGRITVNPSYGSINDLSTSDD